MSLGKQMWDSMSPVTPGPKKPWEELTPLTRQQLEEDAKIEKQHWEALIKKNYVKVYRVNGWYSLKPGDHSE